MAWSSEQLAAYWQSWRDGSANRGSRVPGDEVTRAKTGTKAPARKGGSRVPPPTAAQVRKKS